VVGVELNDVQARARRDHAPLQRGRHRAVAAADHVAARQISGGWIGELHRRRHRDHRPGSDVLGALRQRGQIRSA
jgi:hypothetical protein